MAVTENDLGELFKELVTDLNVKIKSGEATGKDKEIALQLLKTYNISLTLEQAEPLQELSEDLPFSEMHPN